MQVNWLQILRVNLEKSFDLYHAPLENPFHCDVVIMMMSLINQCHGDCPMMALLDERMEETGQSLVGDHPPAHRCTTVHSTRYILY